MRDLCGIGPFAGVLLEEEEQVDWLETELSLIDRVGEANYLAQQIHD
jgi:bacterioferritin